MYHTLQTVLTEETTHASLAFETVRWAAARDATARDAIRAAFQELRGRCAKTRLWVLKHAKTERFVLFCWCH